MSKALNMDTAEADGRHPFFWIVLLLAAVIVGFYAFAGVMIFTYGAFSKDFGWEAFDKDDSWYISRVDQQGVAAGKLQAGDRILAINGDTRISRLGPWMRYRAAPDSSYTISIARDSAQQDIELTIPLRRDYRHLGHILSLLPVSLAFCVVAVLIGIYKAHEWVARLWCVTGLAVGLALLEIALWPLSGFFKSYELAIYFLIGAVVPLHFALAYHFFYRFPPSVRTARLWSFLKYLLYAWGVVILVAAKWRDILLLQGDQVALSFLVNYPYYGKILKGVSSYQTVAAVAICAILIRNYRIVREPDERRRLKWVFYGSIIGILPLVLWDLAASISSASGYSSVSGSGAFVDLLRIVNMFTVIIPISTGYAIIKHHVFDINVVVRRGLQYLLAKNALRIILVLPIAGLLITVLSHPERTLTEILFRNSIYFYILLIATVAASQAFRGRLSEWIDRRFFREHYNQEKLLRELIEDVKKLNSITEMSKRVSDQVERALHPDRIYLFYKEEHKHDLSLGYSSDGISSELRIPEEFRLLRFMEDQGSAQEFPFPRKNNLPLVEKEWLARLGTELIVPMTGTGERLTGLFLLGRKKSETPYTASDRQLLEALADQISIVYENVRLKERVDRDRKIKHEVLSRFEGQSIHLLKECPSCGACFDSSVQLCAKDGCELVLSLPVERVIEGRYRLDQLIGKGGMGAVYEAMQLKLNRRVAVKILSGSMFGNSGALRRFEREARASARLNHPHIITVYDYGLLNTEGAYLVMELVYGETLAAAIQRDRKIYPKVIAELFDQILEGVKAAHDAGIIHRDLKPDNILISRSEDEGLNVKILDFGLAKIAQPNITDSQSPGNAPLTTPGAVMGTFGYMSPEQLTGGVVDERSDFFSIGVMVVEALTGRRPFRGRSHHELLASILQESFRLQHSSPEAQHLSLVLQKCLSKDQTMRFATAADAQKELIPAIANCSPSAFDDSADVEPDTIIYS